MIKVFELMLGDMDNYIDIREVLDMFVLPNPLKVWIYIYDNVLF